METYTQDRANEHEMFYIRRYEASPLLRYLFSSQLERRLEIRRRLELYLANASKLSRS